MTDEDRKDEEQPQAEQPSAEQAPPETEQPAENPDAPGREAEEASGGDSEQPAPEEASPETQEPVAEEAPAEAEQPAAEEAPAEAEEPAAEEAPPAAKPADEPKDSAKAKDVPPGAELEPIKIEPQRELSAEERARLEAELTDLPTKVPTLRGLHWGPVTGGRNQSFTHCFVMLFDDKAGLEAYNTHPDHLHFSTAFRKACATQVAVDFESGT